MRFFIVISLLMVFQSCWHKANESVHPKRSLKVIRLAAPLDVKTHDPIYAEDFYSSREVAKVYEGLLEYNYLKRPYQLQGNVAENLPQVSEDGKKLTFKIRRGIFFHQDQCLKKAQRELTAHDVRYSLMRNASPFEQSAGWWAIEGKIVGLDKWRENSLQNEFSNFDEEVVGLKVENDQTLTIELTQNFPQFLYILAMPYFFITPRECVEFYGKEFARHPVGTGPFYLKELRPKLKMVYERNPNFREKYYPREATKEFNSSFLEDGGKKIPFLDRIEVHIVEQSTTRFLKFMRNQLDLIDLPQEQFASVLDSDGKLKDEYQKKNIQLLQYPQMSVSLFSFNFDNPLFQNEKLRKALSMAYDSAEDGRLFFNSRLNVAQSIIPPGLDGVYEENYLNPYKQYNLEKAKELLKEAGYPEGLGLPLITYDTLNTSDERLRGEFLKKSFEALGVKVKIILNTWPDLLNKVAKRNVMLFRHGAVASYPDALYFFSLYYGPNRYPGLNFSNYKNEEFDRLYLLALSTVDENRRNNIYRRMNHLLGEDVAAIFNLNHQGNYLVQSRVKNFIWSSVGPDQMLYININPSIPSRSL